MMEKDQAQWLGGKIVGWRDFVVTLAGMARRHPQTAYAGLQKSLQQESAFTQCVTPGIRMEFQEVEDELRYIFLRSLFQGLVPDPREGDHRSPSQAGWYCPPQPYSDLRVELDIVLCLNRTHHCNAPWGG